MQVEFRGVQKAYGGQPVLEIDRWGTEAGETWLVRGPSGVGKTTFLRLLLGLETPDSGEMIGADKLRFSACFQENRLCAPLSAVLNVSMVCDAPDRARIEQALSEILPAESLYKPARTLSGGMARRVALARAMLAPSDVVVLDEPFAGLDADTMEKAVKFVQKYRAGRTLLLVSHELSAFPEAKILHLAPPSCILNTEKIL